MRHLWREHKNENEEDTANGEYHTYVAEPSGFLSLFAVEIKKRGLDCVRPFKNGDEILWESWRKYSEI